jgi:hypothetical protein
MIDGTEYVGDRFMSERSVAQHWVGESTLQSQLAVAARASFCLNGLHLQRPPCVQLVVRAASQEYCKQASKPINLLLMVDFFRIFEVQRHANATRNEPHLESQIRRLE